MPRAGSRRAAERKRTSEMLRAIASAFIPEQRQTDKSSPVQTVLLRIPRLCLCHSLLRREVCRCGGRRVVGSVAGSEKVEVFSVWWEAVEGRRACRGRKDKAWR